MLSKKSCEKDDVMPVKIMKKAENWLNANVGSWTDEQRDALVVLLKEQDRDTRHACAESCLQANKEQELVCSAFHEVVMNCRGGVE